MKTIGVGMLGFGNVGAGVVHILENNRAAIENRLGAHLEIRAIAVRDVSKPRQAAVDPARLTTDLRSVYERDDVSLVCELIGGEDSARSAVIGAIEHGKHIVTANKALIASHGEEIFRAAQARHVDCYFEAAVCGGVPIIRALREGLASDRIRALYGIVNGTSNFILSRMARDGVPFDKVLAEAQAAGYAEADPTLDVGGGDAAHKLAILATLSFGRRVTVDDIFVDGIDKLEPIDFSFADRLGFVIKPLAIAVEHPHGIEARVHAAMVPRSWLLADVDNAKNALYVTSDALGPSLYYGAGAGMMPTAMAVVSDVIEVCRNLRAGATGTLPIQTLRPQAPPMIPRDRFETAYYLRFSVSDRPGCLGRITTVLGQQGISIAELVQEKGATMEAPARLVMLTHRAAEYQIQRALHEIVALDINTAAPVIVRCAVE